MKILLLDANLRKNSAKYVSFAFWWEKEAVHKLISYIVEKNSKVSFYLFNFIKIWQKKYEV